MADEFAKKEVFDANMQRLDQRFDALEKRMGERFDAMQIFMEKTLVEMKADNEKLRSEIRENSAQFHNEIRVLDTRIDAVNTRIDSLQTTVYWGFALMGLILAFTTFAPALLEFVKSLRRPSVTMEDVERAIAAAIGQASGLNTRS